MSEYYKYPRTMHLPWSNGTTSDDRIMHDISPLIGKHVVVTEKLDGENCNMYRDRIHARSLDSNDHPSRHWVKGLWGSMRHEIPEGWRICGENVYAKHSIPYENLPTYFFVFSIWNEANECLSWKETLEVCSMLGLTAVPLIAEMVFDEKWLKDYYENMDVSVMEGYVVRNVEAFGFDDFQDNVAKVVRAKHVTTSKHWMTEQIVPNKLREQGTL